MSPGLVNCSNTFIALYIWWSPIPPYIRLCGSDHHSYHQEILTEIIVFTDHRAWGSKQCCVGNISSSLMSNYSKTDQLRLALTISKHICSMSALWSCGRDILIFTKYNIMTARKTLTTRQSSLQSLDNWQARLAELKQELFLAYAFIDLYQIDRK